VKYKREKDLSRCMRTLSLELNLMATSRLMERLTMILMILISSGKIVVLAT